MNVNGYEIEISNEEKIFYPKAGISKREVVEYWRAVAPVIVRHIRGRPLTLLRFPDGIREEKFYQKRAPEYLPEWIDTLEVPYEQEQMRQVLCNKEETLVYLAQLAVLEIHPWLSRAPELSYPDRLVFDLDPPAAGAFSRVKEAAFQIREICGLLNLPVFAMATGSKGLHTVLPLKRKDSFEQVKLFARTFAQELARRSPESLTVEYRKNQRKGRIFLDSYRNAYGQSAVAPYSLRAKEGAPVASPLEWEELEVLENARPFSLRTMQERIRDKGDVWEKMDEKAVSLADIQASLQRALS